MSVSSNARALKKPRGRKKNYSVFKVFFCVNAHFEAKPSKVVKYGGDPFFDVGPGFKNKCTIIYVKNVE